MVILDKRKIPILISQLLALIVCILVENISFYLFCCLVICFLIVFEAKFSFFSEISFVLTFSLIQTWVQATWGNASGMIENAHSGVPLYENIHGICTLLFLISMYFTIVLTSICEDEQSLYRYKIEFGPIISGSISAVVIILTVMLFPTIPKFVIDENRRSQGLISEYGFVLVVFLLLALLYDTASKYKVIYLLYCFVAFWVIGHGERVELLGFLSYILLKFLANYTDKNNINSVIKKTAKIGVIIFVFLLFCTWVGYYRMGLKVNSLFFLVKKLLIQATAGDVIYVFDCSVDMWKNKELVYGKTYLDYLYQLIPGASNRFQAAQYIKEYYFTMGGGLFFTEPMMNFGIWGVVVSNTIFCGFYRWIVKHNNLFFSMVWIPMVIELFRTTWYGRNGWVLASCVEVPLLYLLFKVLRGMQK